jgi:hypothetical protein
MGLIVIKIAILLNPTKLQIFMLFLRIKTPILAFINKFKTYYEKKLLTIIYVFDFILRQSTKCADYTL